MTLTTHPILQQSFAIIDQEIGEHGFTSEEYTIVQRVIHSTADFEFQHLIRFSPGAIAQAIVALTQGVPIITDVTMVSQGIRSLVQQTFNNPVYAAINHSFTPVPGQTRTETGLLECWRQFPTAIYVIGNAPTALLALCKQIKAQRGASHSFQAVSPSTMSALPALVIGAPVGFVSVVESKRALAQSPVPQIQVAGRKGGSAVAAAIVNALLTLAWQRQSATVDLP